MVLFDNLFNRNIMFINQIKYGFLFLFVLLISFFNKKTILNNLDMKSLNKVIYDQELLKALNEKIRIIKFNYYLILTHFSLYIVGNIALVLLFDQGNPIISFYKMLLDGLSLVFLLINFKPKEITAKYEKMSFDFIRNLSAIIVEISATKLNKLIKEFNKSNFNENDFNDINNIDNNGSKSILSFLNKKDEVYKFDNIIVSNYDNLNKIKKKYINDNEIIYIFYHKLFFSRSGINITDSTHFY